MTKQPSDQAFSGCLHCSYLANAIKIQTYRLFGKTPARSRRERRGEGGAQPKGHRGRGRSGCSWWPFRKRKGYRERHLRRRVHACAISSVRSIRSANPGSPPVLSLMQSPAQLRQTLILQEEVERGAQGCGQFAILLQKFRTSKGLPHANHSGRDRRNAGHGQQATP